MSRLRVFVRCIFCAAVLAAAAALAHARDRADSGPRLPEICEKWPQYRLLIGGSLKSRHFMLEAGGPIQKVPARLAPVQRKIFHRTFTLSLDVAQAIALYRTSGAKTCVISEDDEKSLPVKVPVFFVGREGQPADKLEADAERTAFARSASLDAGTDFAAVAFRLRRGASSFTDVRPFFACGLAGVILCEGYCPGETPALARSLADWAVNAAPPANEAAPAPAPDTGTAEAQPAGPTPRSAAPPSTKESVTDKPASKPAAVAECPPAVRQEAAKIAQPPAVSEAPRPRVTVETPAPVQAEARKTAPEPQVAEPSVAESEPKTPAPAQPPVAVETRPPPPEAPEAPEMPAPAGTEPATQEAAAPPQQSPAAGETPPAAPPEVPVEAPAPATRRLVLLFRRKSGVMLSPAQILEAEGSIRIEGQALRATPDGLATELPQEVYTGADTPEVLQRLFPHFQVLDVKVEEGQTVITAEPILSPKAGSILIELVSTDGDFTKQLGAEAVESFWTGALGLAGAVSEGPWERKLLARAQSPGVSAQTGILDDSWGRKLAIGPRRDSILEELIQGSRSDFELPSLGGAKPVERFELDLALDPIRRDGGIEGAANGGREALLLIAGGVDPGGGYFCRHPIRPDNSPWAKPRWVSRVQRTFVLEIWSDSVAQALQRISRAKPAGGAPDGIYLCNVPGADGANIALYGIVPEVLSESARAAAFGYLASQASNYLKP